MRLIISALCLLVLMPISVNAEWLVVNGHSMQPTLKPHDKVWFDADAYQHATPNRRDVVALSMGKKHSMMVKRVMALAGDSVRFKNNDLWVNGAVVLSSIDANKLTVLQTQLARYQNIVPSRTLMVLGDNPKASYDSVRFGLISLDQIKGKISSPNTLSKHYRLIAKTIVINKNNRGIKQ